jgi:HD-like signal output (HDOD) protein/tRNA A-37 threonylcarbamoyl transferase component Bud32
MLLLFLLIAASLIMVGLYILLVKQERRTSDASKIIPLKKEIKSPRTDHLKREPIAPPEEILPLETKGGAASSGYEMAVSDVYGDMRRVLQQGIDRIFAGQRENTTVGRLPRVESQVDPQTLRTVEERIGNLKKFRTEHMRLQRFISDPAIQMSDLAKMVLADPVLTAKILRLANSPYFGMQNKIDSISHALMILGLQNIKNVLYREGLLQLFPLGSTEQRDALAFLWKHSTLTSIAASYLADLFNGLNQGTLFTLGIVHDIGKLILLGMPQVQSLDASFWNRFPREVSIHEEDELLGVNHAVIGGLAMHQWGFSDLMIRSVAMHHLPAYADKDGMPSPAEMREYIAALYVADQIAKLFTAGYDQPGAVTPLAESFRGLVDKNRLIKKVMDTSFLSQIREAVTLADSEIPGLSVRPAASVKAQPPDEAVSGPHPVKPGFKADETTIIEQPRHGGTIGRYEIIRELGRGAMGTVYLGRDPLINREVAIKTLRYSQADNEEMIEAKKRFFREAEAAGRLNHPNIVTVYDVGEYQGTAYMAMELLDGTDLVSCCRKPDLLPREEVVRIVSTVALALDYAHSNGVVHRDIKPGNIRILTRGDIKVVDFGIAKVMDTSKTQAGVVIGSPNYMSPEQIEGQKVDGQTDLFSLGVLFFELLTGEKPFVGENITALMHSIVTQPPPSIQDMIPGLPECYVRVLQRSLAKKKEDRYGSGQEIADDLMTCIHE